ncbi:MAG: hypothetical protein E7516_04200 [Ruminococcaceae bacterium]|nr:hypothetical protein [Oscillospiraceae bacterium]
MAKIISVPMAIIISIFSLFFPAKTEQPDKTQWNTNYPYVFVHGLMGWGEYDMHYKILPYWGMFGGELLSKIEKNGYDCYGASVSGTASAWDRACELYAQLTGSVVDYGKAHSEYCGHERYGKDYTGKALIEKWDSDNKINLLGHSFGGATIRVFATLMAKGNEAEIKATAADDISPLFTGGKSDWIYSLTSLAAPHNGTTSYGLENSMPDNTDSAAYDMFIDHALEINKNMVTDQNTYYFSIPCTATTKNSDGTYSADKGRMEFMFQSSSDEIGKLRGTTQGGYVVDESWLENDGLVNTVSACAPSSAPATEFDQNNISKGVWNIMPVYQGDHMSLQGGFFKVNTDVLRLYTEHFDMINRLG